MFLLKIVNESQNWMPSFLIHNKWSIELAFCIISLGNLHKQEFKTLLSTETMQKHLKSTFHLKISDVTSSGLINHIQRRYWYSINKSYQKPSKSCLDASSSPFFSQNLLIMSNILNLKWSRRRFRRIWNGNNVGITNCSYIVMIIKLLFKFITIKLNRMLPPMPKLAGTRPLWGLKAKKKKKQHISNSN